MAERWCSVDEIAAHLGVVRETVYRWIKGKGLPTHRIGKFWKFKISEVDRWAHSPKESQPGQLRNDPLLAEMVGRLVKAFQPEKIYLFGSRARGVAGPDADYDLMVVVPNDAQPNRRRSRLAYQVLWGLRMGADVLVWTRDAFERRLKLKASLPSTIVREGKLLYAA